MKKIRLLTVLAFLAIVNYSCDLEPEIFDSVTAEEMAKRPGFALLSYIGAAYNTFQGEYHYVSRQNYWAMQESSSDEMVVPQRGSHWYDDGNHFKMMTHTWDYDTREIKDTYSYLYWGIGECNYALDFFEANKERFTPTERAEFEKRISEVKVLRAFYHFMACDLYGNVPISRSKLETDIVQKQRKEVYQFVIDELLANIDNLKDGINYGMITRPVGYAILAKVLINSEVMTGVPKWQETIDAIDVVLAYNYSLEMDYSKVFAPDNTNSLEIIWPLIFDKIRAPGMMFHLMTLHYAEQKVFGFTTETWNGHCASEYLMKLYENGDVRKDKSWLYGPRMNGSEPIMWKGNPLVYTIELSSRIDLSGANEMEGARFKKFGFQRGVGHHADNDFPLLRLADMYLLKAEALYRLNGTITDGELNETVNQVRDRARCSDWTSGNFTLDKLLEERARELCWEGFRRQDLIRFGKFDKAWWEKPASAKGRNIYPIPKPILEANPSFVQNPHYVD